MWNYEKRLEYPVRITKPNAKIAQIIMSQYGGPDGEMGASMRYLSQRYSMPDRRVVGVLTDVGTEELAQRRWKWSNIMDFQGEQVLHIASDPGFGFHMVHIDDLFHAGF